MRIQIHIAKCFLLGVLCFFAVPAYSQYFSNLYDCNSNHDFGTSIVLLSNGNYLVVDGITNSNTGQFIVGALVISQDGTQIIKKTFITPPPTVSYYTVGFGNGGGYGKLACIDSANYLNPIVISYPLVYFPVYPTHIKTEASLLRINSSADTTLFVSFTDTSVHTELANAVAYSAVNHHYILGGQTYPKAPNDSFGNAKGLLVISDTNGHILYRREYENKGPIPPVPPNGVTCRVNSVEALPDGRILIGAANGTLDVHYGKWPGPYQHLYMTYYHMRPWFMITDATGNILKDTMYGNEYTNDGNIYTDKLGGYLHWGKLDSFIMENPTDYRNLPAYVAHVDTNFHLEWLHIFGDTSYRVNVLKATQLSKGDLLAVGEYQSNIGFYGWASRLSRTGTVKWERTYKVDTTSVPYLVDAKERPDGSLILAGMGRHLLHPDGRLQDVWLLSIDSNGCEIPGCSPTRVPPVSPPKAGFMTYPNPTKGELNVTAANAGSLVFYNLQGSRVAAYNIAAGKSAIHLPRNLAAGIYTGRFLSADGKESDIVRIVYQP